LNFIRFDHVTYQYPEAEDTVFALRDVSFDIQPGQFVAIVGANSSGKTTLGRLCNMLLTPTKGSVIVAGMDTAETDHLYPIRSKVGMIFQNPDNQIVSTTVEEEIAFGLENLQIPSPEIKRRVSTIVQEMDLESLRDRPPHLLSGGQKQLLCIASVLAMEPSCIVFDEPTSLLDPVSRKLVLQQIHKLHKKGMTVLYITHIMEEILMADLLLILKKGEIVFEGNPIEAFSFDDATLYDYHLYPPQLIQIMNRLHESGVKIPKGIVTTKQLTDYLCQYK
jgi:energy-coupling factor transport system ATP-binding protein